MDEEARARVCTTGESGKKFDELEETPVVLAPSGRSKFTGLSFPRMDDVGNGGDGENAARVFSMPALASSGPDVSNSRRGFRGGGDRE